MKKIILTKTTTADPKSVGNGNATLIDRKSMLGNYKKLFEALFDLPDKKVVARILDAINNAEKRQPEIEVIELCSKCNQKTPKTISVDVSTQTDDKITMQHTTVGNSDDSRNTPPLSTQTVNPLSTVDQFKTDSTLNNTRNQVKRKRRRKNQLPQVIKKSHAQEQQQRNKPILQKRKANVLKNNERDCKKSGSTVLNEKRQRQDSVSSFSSLLFSDREEEHLIGSVTTPDYIKNVLADEYLKSECKDAEGLWPIHSAIVKDDTRFLERQILVWKRLKNIDLNEILTDDDEDCLQLAILEKSSPEIVNILLSNGLDADCRDANSNTIIHLAIINEAPANILQLLMQKIDLETLFVINYDGYTPLHLAVRRNNYLLAEIFLDNLDKRLIGESHYDREKMPNDKHEETKFLKYYESRCDRLHLQEYLRKYKKEDLLKKRKLIDAVDVCSGNSLLLCAIENKLEHLIYFLLAHFADPGVENLSGQTPTSFMNEFAKSLNLSLRIDQAMQNIEFLLNK